MAALSEWPQSGVPQNPGAWLMAVAKRRAIDGFRRNHTLARKHAEIGRDLEDERRIRFRGRSKRPWTTTSATSC